MEDQQRRRRSRCSAKTSSASTPSPIGACANFEKGRFLDGDRQSGGHGRRRRAVPDDVRLHGHADGRQPHTCPALNVPIVRPRCCSPSLSFVTHLPPIFATYGLVCEVKVTRLAAGERLQTAAGLLRQRDLADLTETAIGDINRPSEHVWSAAQNIASTARTFPQLSSPSACLYDWQLASPACRRAGGLRPALAARRFASRAAERTKATSASPTAFRRRRTCAKSAPRTRRSGIWPG